MTKRCADHAWAGRSWIMEGIDYRCDECAALHDDDLIDEDVFMRLAAEAALRP